ncbi:MAG: ribonuclease J [Deltaproteobacteria bacterium]|nr:ribonuclease J [Deltaproteobacteria bacterium]
MAIGQRSDNGEEDILIVDAGVRFLGNDGFGFDAGLPDLDRLSAMQRNVHGYVVTHGHEDHIGALPPAINVCRAPIFSTPYTAALVERRFERSRAALPQLTSVEFGKTFEVGPFRVHFLAVSHSIPDASIAVIECEAGRVVHSGDFRVDVDPLEGLPTDRPGMSNLGDLGVDVLLTDSTSAATPGKNPGERSVVPVLQDIMEKADGLVVIGSFGTHLSRMVAVCEAARASGRKVFLCGRSLMNTAALGSRFRPGLVDDVMDINALGGHLRERAVVMATGTQGETLAALPRMARQAHPKITLKPGDQVVLSSRVIPGNERLVAEMLDRLAEQGVETKRVPGAHVSGHGHHDDMRELILAVRPRHFVAVHGGGQQLRQHRSLAEDLGLGDSQIHPLLNGQTLFLEDGEATLVDGEPAKEPFISEDGGVCESPQPFLRARRQMSTGGVAFVVVDDKGAEMFQHAVFPRIDAERLQGIATRVYRAFVKGDHAAEFDEDGDFSRAVVRFVRARLTELDCGSVEIAVQDLRDEQ